VSVYAYVYTHTKTHTHTHTHIHRAVLLSCNWAQQFCSINRLYPPGRGVSRRNRTMATPWTVLMYAWTLRKVNQLRTYRIQNVCDATAWPGDPRHDPSYRAAGLHNPQLTVKQQMERKDAAESCWTHFWFCTYTHTQHHHSEYWYIC